MQEVYSTQKKPLRRNKYYPSKIQKSLGRKNVKILRVSSTKDSSMIDSDDEKSKNLFPTNLVLKRELNIQTKISIFENCK